MQSRYCVKSGKKKNTTSKFKKPSQSPYARSAVKNKINNKTISKSDSSSEDMLGNSIEIKSRKSSNDKSQKKLQTENRPSKRPEVSKSCVSLAIKILKEIDPKKKMKKEEVISQLKEILDQTNDLSKIQAVEYLMESLENLEEKLEEFEQYRQVQEKKLTAARLDDEVFTARINLDSDQREPDENDRIFRLGKKVFSGSNQRYKKQSSSTERKTMKMMMPKKDFRKLKNYNI